MSSPRKICVVTGSRAEYGLLYWLLKEIQADSRLKLQLVVTGMHLAPQFGMTIKEIEADGFIPDAKVEMLLSSDTPVGIAKSMGLGVIGCAEVFQRLQPDILVILGDRFEILAAAQAAMLARIPLAHIHGGESTEGAINEAIRHSLTKMSHLHFVAAEEYRKRVIQLGECPDHVWNVGAPGVDSIRLLSRLDRKELSDSLGFDFTRPYLLVTYHPVTLASTQDQFSIANLLEALQDFQGHCIVITGVNADPGNSIINHEIDSFCHRFPERVFKCLSFGQHRYLSVLAHSDVVIGNSSSGVIEAPALKVPTVNVGDRQRGRVKADSVIDVGSSRQEIGDGVRRALSSEFREKILEMKYPFGDGHSCEKIVAKLREVSVDTILLKKFFDLV